MRTGSLICLGFFRECFLPVGDICNTAFPYRSGNSTVALWYCLLMAALDTSYRSADTLKTDFSEAFEFMLIRA